MQKPSLKFIIPIILAFFLNACTSTLYTDRSQIMLLDAQQEIALGEQNAKQILKNAKISNDNVLIQMIQRVGSRIAKGADRPDFQWEFYLLESPQINAFCLPGGKVFVYTGLMQIIANDDELAVVLSHEIAHAILRHGAERLSMQQLQQIGGSFLGMIVNATAPGYDGLFSQAYNLGSNVGVMLPFSRSHELEADEVGIILMQKAGYNPRAALTFWEKMTQSSKSNSTDFFSTHPSDSKRIEALQKILENP